MILSKLTKQQSDKVLDSMKILSYKAGEIIFKKGSVASQKIIVVIGKIILLEGNLKKLKGGNHIVGKGQVWGD